MRPQPSAVTWQKTSATSVAPAPGHQGRVRVILMELTMKQRRSDYEKNALACKDTDYADKFSILDELVDRTGRLEPLSIAKRPAIHRTRAPTVLETPVSAAETLAPRHR